MARPTKAGIEYFTLDVDLDDKFELIEARYGIEGFGLVIKILQLIYKNGYFYEVSEEKLLLLKKRVNMDTDRITAIIEDAVRWGLFDRETFKIHRVLTSRGIQKRYIEATIRRREVEFIRDYLLIEIGPETYPKRVNVNIYPVNACNNPVNADINPQSKVKESKVKETTTTQPPAPDGAPVLSPGNDGGHPVPPPLQPAVPIHAVATPSTGARPPQHYEKAVGEYFKAIKSAADHIIRLQQNGVIRVRGQPFNPHAMVQKFANERKHPGAIAKVMGALAAEQTWKGGELNPWAYGRAIMKTVNGNFNERDALAIHREMKTYPEGVLSELTQGMLKSI